MSVSKTLRVSAMALLLVTAGLSSFVTMPAEADTYTETISDGSVEFVVAETSGTDEAKIEIWGTYSENGNEYTHFLRRTTVNKDKTHYLDVSGAYDSYEVKVTTSSSTTSVTIYGSDGQFDLDAHNIGDVGADTNLKCGLGEQAGSVFGTFYTDCNPVPEDSINTTSLDANETKLEIYQNGLTANKAQDLHFATLDNYLTDSRSIALLEGKAAYIRALNNGSTESVAVSKAKSAVRDYYSARQKALIDNFNTSVVNAHYNYRVANETGGIGDHYVGINATGVDEQKYEVAKQPSTETVTLVNNSNQQTTSLGAGYVGSSWNYYEKQSFTLTEYNATITASDGNQVSNLHGVTINATASGEPEQKQYLHLKRYTDRWNRIENQSNEVEAEIEVFANNTYDAYQEGDINNSDLIDPFLAQREYGPDDGNFTAWAATSLTLLGSNSPETLDSTGNFTVTDHADGDTTYNGILLSDENPASGTFEAGTTYDARELNGTQYVVTSSQVHELTGNFTVDQITNNQGDSVQSVQYRNLTYTSTTTEGYRETLANVSETLAQIEAQQLAASTVGGGTTDGDSMPEIFGQPAWLVAMVAIAGVIVLNNVTKN